MWAGEVVQNPGSCDDRNKIETEFSRAESSLAENCLIELGPYPSASFDLEVTSRTEFYSNGDEKVMALRKLPSNELSALLIEN